MTNPKTKILAFAGSARKDSYNKKLLRQAVDGALGEGVEVTIIDLADYPLPFYDEDYEAANGMPENGKKLLQLFASHDGFIITSPDYNGSYTALLKNVFDWMSRGDTTSATPVEPFKDKVAAIMSISTGGRGGLKGLDKLRDLLDDLKVMVLPDMYAVGFASKAFNEAGKLNDEKAAKAVHGIGAKLAKTAKKMKP